MAEDKSTIKRRDFLRSGLNSVAGLTLGGISGLVISRASTEDLVFALVLGLLSLLRGKPNILGRVVYESKVRGDNDSGCLY